MQHSNEGVHSTAYSHGNYAAAYVSDGGASPLMPTVFDDLEGSAGIPVLPTNGRERVTCGCAVVAGFVLGYYSSYERYEVPHFDLELYDAALLWTVWRGIEHHIDEPDDDTCGVMDLVHRSALVELAVDTLRRYFS